MTIHQCNCGSCTNKSCQDHPSHYATIHDAMFHRVDVVWNHSKEKGFMCHSKSREYITKDAIEIVESQLGCSMMLSDDGNDKEAYKLLRDECVKAIKLLNGE